MNPADGIRQPGRSVFMELSRGWKRIRAGDGLLYLPERMQRPEKLLRLLSDGTPRMAQLRDWANATRSTFAGVIETPNCVFAAVDKIRSIPLFYSLRDGEIFISNSARTLRNGLQLDRVDDTALLELRMAGYVTRRNTVYEGLYQLQAGECLFWDRKADQVQRERYYRYHPVSDTGGDEQSLIRELGDRTDEIFGRIVAEARGRPIWVPLSGGLDSRLVLCKLKEHGASSLQSFSYGPPRNHESTAAQEVAERLNVPWFHISVRGRETRDFFASDERRAYWQLADGLSVVPSMTEALVLIRLRDERRLPGDAVMVNGQSGDFITGNHIPPSLMEREVAVEDLLDAVVGKHYSLWSDLKIPANLALVRRRILDVLEEAAEGTARSGRELASLFELWECQERQAKAVVNGQRIYDYLELGWELPLWDDEYLKFWSGVPVELRFRQELYREYLRHYDSHGLFAADPPAFRPRSTPGWRYFPVHGVAKLLEIVGGEEANAAFRRYARYVGYYSPQYRSYPFRFFLRHAAHHRNPVSFFAETWIEENLGLRLRS